MKVSTGHYTTIERHRMKITIEPETDAENGDPRIKRMVYTGIGPMVMLAIPTEHPEQTAMYLHSPDPPVVTLSLLDQRVRELEFLLLKARLTAEAQHAQQQPLIKVPQAPMPDIPFPGRVNDRLKGK